jgi:hypothetical protein
MPETCTGVITQKTEDKQSIGLVIYIIQDAWSTHHNKASELIIFIDIHQSVT